MQEVSSYEKRVETQRPKTLVKYTKLYNGYPAAPQNRKHKQHTREDTVWEIGTGKGHLTQVLCHKCGFLYSVEIDRKLFEKAKERLIPQTNLKLIYGDLWKSYTTLTNAIFIPCHRWIPFCFT